MRQSIEKIETVTDRQLQTENDRIRKEEREIYLSLATYTLTTDRQLQTDSYRQRMIGLGKKKQRSISL
jgi:hypothetical protein